MDQNKNRLKALILCGGKGTRLKPLTFTTPKQLIPVANKPILAYVLDQIIDTGITEIGIIVSPDTGDQIKDSLAASNSWPVQFTFISQPEPLGLAHAVKTARDFLGDSSFLMFLGDNLIQGSIKSFTEQFNRLNPDAFILLKEVDDPRLFGVAELNSAGEIINIVEKPKQPRSKLAIPGIYIFTSTIHEAIDNIKPSWRGELEITDSIQKLIDMGKVVQSHILTGWWLDTGKKDDLLEANKIVLHDLLKQNCCGNIDKDTTMTGIVEVMAGSIVINSKLLGPVSIAENCKIINSTIGPCVSIGSGTTIENSAIEDSVILPECHIANIDLLKESVVGNGSTVIKNKDNSNLVRLFLGDVNRVEI